MSNPGMLPNQVLMATNRIDILDPALLRPGRIDRKIEFPNPNESSRADILRIHSRKMNLVRGIDLRKIADKMTGASGAELKARHLLPPLVILDFIYSCGS
jgi:26S proteasome regulatory subunit T6